MNYKCPKCNIEYSSIAWDTETLKTKGLNKINVFRDDDIKSIEMQIQNYSYICTGCAAEAVIGIAGLT